MSADYHARIKYRYSGKQRHDIAGVAIGCGHGSGRQPHVGEGHHQLSRNHRIGNRSRWAPPLRSKRHCRQNRGCHDSFASPAWSASLEWRKGPQTLLAKRQGRETKLTRCRPMRRCPRWLGGQRQSPGGERSTRHTDSREVATAPPASHVRLPCEHQGWCRQHAACPPPAAPRLDDRGAPNRVARASCPRAEHHRSHRVGCCSATRSRSCTSADSYRNDSVAAARSLASGTTAHSNILA